jgi:hypothetical protein
MSSKRLLELDAVGWVVDLAKILMVGPLDGDKDRPQYEVIFDGGVRVIINDLGQSVHVGDIPCFSRLKLLIAWDDYIDAISPTVTQPPRRMDGL